MINKILQMNSGYLSNTDNTTIFTAEQQLAVKNANKLYDICADKNNNIYATDPENHIVIKIRDNGQVINFSGTVGVSGNNGNNIVAGNQAKFNSPQGIDCDESGNIYVADTGNNQIRKINQDGVTSLLAGDPNGTAGYTGTKLNKPQDIIVQKNNIIIADTNNHAIRIVRHGLANINTLVGNGNRGDSVGQIAQLNSPSSVALSPSGKIFINDSGNNKIKIYNLAGVTTNFVGSTRGGDLGQGTNAQFYDLQFIVSDNREGLYVVDYDRSTGSRLLHIDGKGQSYAVHYFNDLPASGLHINSSGKIYVCVSDYREDLYDIERVIIGDSQFGVIN